MTASVPGGVVVVLHILIADDNPLSLRYFVEALARPGTECIAVASGEEAISRCRTQRFDLLLLDARMPGSSGTETLACIRESDGDSRNSVAIATTAADDADTIAGLRRAGFTDVLTKPITIAALRAAVERHLVQRSDAMVSAPCGRTDLDDDGALRISGGDPAIVAALRGLLAAELAKLREEFRALSASRDCNALDERLHRLDASAGFCGAAALTHAIAIMRRANSRAGAWPTAAIAEFLRACDETRVELMR
ncbi:MAG: response regulator [Rhodanobacteraceae bacterium]